MWIASRYGWVSIVCARADEGKGDIDTETMMIRGRRKEHLEALQNAFEDLAPYSIIESHGTDYLYRIVCPKQVAKNLVSELVEEIEWGNFKGEAAKFAKGNFPDSDYVSALHKTWGVMYDIQK